mgnify:CR=1 FL=1
MSDTSNFGFGKLVPGFDFLQSLAKGASNSIPQLPNLSNWVAPTISVEELEKRIDELKAVQFWLEQNSRALAATICECAPIGLRATKKAAMAYIEGGEQAAVACIPAIKEQVFATEDFKEGIQSFVERRQARFSGR